MATSLILEYLSIGSLEDAKQFEKDYPSSDIVCLLAKRPASEPANAIHVPIISNAGHVKARQLDKAVTVIHALATRGDRTLLHCDNGNSLSPLVMAWYLHKNNGFSMDQAFDYVKTHRSQITDRTEWLKIDE